MGSNLLKLIKKWFSKKKKGASSPLKSRRIDPSTLPTSKVEEKNISNISTSRVYTVKEIQHLVVINYPPFTWERIGLFLYKEFMEYGKPFPKLQENDTLDAPLIASINRSLQIFYNKKLPISH